LNSGQTIKVYFALFPVSESLEGFLLLLSRHEAKPNGKTIKRLRMFRAEKCFRSTLKAISSLISFLFPVLLLLRSRCIIAFILTRSTAHASFELLSMFVFLSWRHLLAL
jgi:hypothetical protein